MDDATSTEQLVDRTVSQPVAPSSLGRYDAIILAIPLVYLIGLILSLADIASLQVLVTTSSLLAIAVIADALFGNPPKSIGRRQRGSAEPEQGEQ